MNLIKMIDLFGMLDKHFGITIFDDKFEIPFFYVKYFGIILAQLNFLINND